MACKHKAGLVILRAQPFINLSSDEAEVEPKEDRKVLDENQKIRREKQEYENFINNNSRVSNVNNGCAEITGTIY